MQSNDICTAGSVKNRNALPPLFLSTTREAQAYGNGTASLVLPVAWVRVQRLYMAIQEMELLDKALGPQNAPKRSTVIPFRVSRILAKSADGQVHG